MVLLFAHNLLSLQSVKTFFKLLDGRKEPIFFAQTLRIGLRLEVLTVILIAIQVF